MNQSPSQNPNYETRGAAVVRRRFFSLPTLLLFLILLAFVFFVVTRFDLDWQATFATISSMNPWLYLIGFALYYATFLLRGQRWRVLARNTGELETIPDARLPTALAASSYIIIGWFVNSITWLRLGDGYRAWLFARGSGGSFSWSLGTLLAERVLDVAAMLVILVMSALLLSTTDLSAVSVTVVQVTLAVVVLSLGALLAMKAWGSRFARFLPARLEQEFHRFQSGTLGSMKQMPTVFALGGSAWALEVARLYFVVQALGLDAPVSLIAIAALGAAILSTVPIPGGVGVVESGIIGILLLSLGQNDAVSVALVDRSITFISVIAIGGAVFLVSQVRRPRRKTPEHT